MHAEIIYQVSCDMETGEKRSVAKYLVKFRHMICKQL